MHIVSVTLSPPINLNLATRGPPSLLTFNVLSLLPLTNILESEDHAIWYTGPTCDLKDRASVNMCVGIRPYPPAAWECEASPASPLPPGNMSYSGKVIP